MTLECSHIDGLAEVAAKILNALGSPGVVLFDGPMGAGKTTLISALANQMEVEDDVSSPTFSLVNEYLLPNGRPLFHFDFYRIEDEEEALDIGIEEYFDSGNWCFIEWPDRIPNLLPERHKKVTIRVEGAKRIYEVHA